MHKFFSWLQNCHAPLGRLAPFAASALFAASAFSHSLFLRIAAYTGATILVILIAIDLASELLEPEEQDRSQNRGVVSSVPLSPFQFVLAAIQAVTYTFFIFVGLGPATPFVFLIPVFAFASFASWRNVRLWYRQGSQFACRLYDLQAEEAIRREHAHDSTGEFKSKRMQVGH